MKTAVIWVGVICIVLVAMTLFYKESLHPTGSTAVTTSLVAPAITFYCMDNATIQAAFATSSVALSLSDGRMFSLPQTVSGSGTRYETTIQGKDIVFSSEGSNAFLTENGTETYQNCTAATIASSTASDEDTYTDQGKTFTFEFPSSFSVAGTAPGYSTNWSAEATTSGVVLATIMVPQSYEPGTNFADAIFTVGTSADPSAVATCLENPNPTPLASSSATSINGISFEKLSYSDVGTGNYYDTTSYRTVQSNQCYAVEYTIHYANIENYPMGAVKPFNEAQLTTKLDAIAESFKFLN